ncbi:MAG: 8-amino-7-oxononanoate synthase [Proteobacteria bacterium]|nr:8-amino-7-oxononanoate synthase [Pseudomonadota bacterium]
MKANMLYQPYKEYLAATQEKEQWRCLQIRESGDYLDFSNNDYLTLNSNSSVMKAANNAMQEFGLGSTGSRLLSGNYDLFSQLESQIAKSHNTESALVLNSGYQANLAVVAALLNKQIIKQQAIAFCDKGVHASIYQGIKLSGAHLVRYQHNDLTDLQELLALYANDPRPKFILTESLHGMEGDAVDLSRLISLVEKYNAFLYLDEAHAIGILGPSGYGLSSGLNMRHIPHMIMGTFSKALGVFGAYVAGSSVLKDYLLNKCAGFIYSTALPPMVIGAALRAWTIVGDLQSERIKLLSMANILRTKLKELGFNTGASNAHIFPIILGGEQKAMHAKELLAHRKILVSTIRPPTVPPASSRIRIALTLKHTEKDIERLLLSMKGLRQELE